jgi:predicted transcriptional regulator of viral defense system
MTGEKDISINQWLDKVLAKGIYSFSKEALKEDMPEYTDIAVKRALSRLSSRGKIISLHKGYYLIIPPQYASRGILPPPLYLDTFMKYLKRPYYLALLSAAAFHGASHQQPQEYFVMTSFPVLRPVQKKGLKINYISTKGIPESLLEKRKTEVGYLNISNPALTACDLIQFEKRIGGISRAATVLCELAEAINPTDFSSELLKHVPVTTLQRLGYLLETICFHPELAESLYRVMGKEKLRLFRIPLKPNQPTKDYSSGNRWKIIVNISSCCQPSIESRNEYS